MISVNKKTMKQIFILVNVFIFLSIASVAAQDVKSANIYVMKTGDNSKGVNLGDPPSKLEGLLGTPDRVYDYNLQISGKTAKVFQYGLNLFYFVDDALMIYDLYDAKVSVGAINGTSYKVGDNLTVTTRRDKLGPGTTYHTTVIKSFLDFKVKAAPGKTRNIPYEALIQAWIDQSDSMFEIVFDKSNKIINIMADDL